MADTGTQLPLPLPPARPLTTHRDAIRTAFAALRKQGYIARMNFMCCGGCAVDALARLIEVRDGDPATAKVVYYHRQDAEAFNRHGNLRRNMYLGWQGDANEIVLALEAQGVRAIFDGNPQTRIEVLCAV